MCIWNSRSSKNYYVSTRFVVLLVIAGVGGLIYFFFTIGRIPAQSLVIIVLSGIYTLIAIGRSIFFRPGSE